MFPVWVPSWGTGRSEIPSKGPLAASLAGRECFSTIAKKLWDICFQNAMVISGGRNAFSWVAISSSPQAPEEIP